jgi:hypothetical protein
MNNIGVVSIRKKISKYRNIEMGHAAVALSSQQIISSKSGEFNFVKIYNHEAVMALHDSFRRFDDLQDDTDVTESDEEIYRENFIDNKNDNSTSDHKSTSSDHKMDEVSGKDHRLRKSVLDLLCNMREKCYAIASAEQLAQRCAFCHLIGLETVLEQAWNSGLTPLVLDTSPDDKVNTFFSYQPDVLTYNAKELILKNVLQGQGKAGLKKPRSSSLMEGMEEIRRHLVMAMKHGKTFHLRLGTSCPDFRTTFNDWSAKGQVVDKEITFGTIPTELKGSWRRSVEKQNLDGTEGLEKEKDSNPKNYHMYGHIHGQIPEECDKMAYFPAIALRKAGRSLVLGQDYWVPRLYREEDIRPHRNFAIAKDNFRIFLTSQLPLEEAAYHLFGYDVRGKGDGNAGRNLPPISYFQIIVIDYGESDEGKEEVERDDEAKANDVN